MKQKLGLLIELNELQIWNRDHVDEEKMYLAKYVSEEGDEDDDSLSQI